MLGPGPNRGELDVARRRRTVVRIPAPTGGCRVAQSAGVVPTRIHRLKRAVRRIGLLMVVATPAVEGAVGLNPAGKPPSGRDLLKARVSRKVQLSLIVGAPALNPSIASERARVVFPGGHLNELRTAGSSYRGLLGRHGFRRSKRRRSPCHRPWPQPRLLNRRRWLSSRLRGARRIPAGDQQRSENGQNAERQETSAPTLSPARRDRTDQTTAPFKGASPHGYSRPGLWLVATLPHARFPGRRTERGNHRCTSGGYYATGACGEVIGRPFDQFSSLDSNGFSCC